MRCGASLGDRNMTEPSQSIRALRQWVMMNFICIVTQVMWKVVFYLLWLVAD